MKKSPAIKRLSARGSFPLSSTQAGFFFLQQMDPRSPILNMVRLDEVKGDINEVWLKKAIEQNIKRHEIFRTQFKESNGEGAQVVLPPDEIHIEVGTTVLGSQVELLKKVDEMGAVAFDLEKPPLIRAHLFKIGPKRLVLLRVIHHIVSDFNSNLLFLKGVSELYEGFRSNKLVSLTEPEIQFGDYAAWEKENVSDSGDSDHLEFWKKELADAPDLLHLPLDHPRPPVIKSNFKMESRSLPLETWKKGQILAHELGVSSFQFNMAAFLLFLHRWSGDEDLCVGSNIDFRKVRGLPDLVGPGINHFVLRSRYEPQMSFRDFAKQVSETARATYPHTDVSVDRLIQLVKPARNLSYAPLFQAMFDVWQKDIPGKNTLQFSRIDYAWLHGNVDISARITEGEEDVTIWFRYNADLFESKTILSMLKCFENLYKEIVLKPSEKVSGLELLSPEDQKFYIQNFCGTTATYETCDGIQEYFERQVDKTPKALALDFESKTLSYQELDSKSNQLAHYLREKGVTRDVFVGVLMDRSLEMFVGILGILKAGGAYVPLDPTYPAERLQFLFEDIEAPVILAQKSLEGILPSAKSQKVLFLDGEWDREISKYPVTRPKLINKIDDAAYMIYTSGSTGKPKGCPNTHRNIGNYLQWVKAKHPMSSTDKLLFRTPYTFDVSVPEILYPLLCGANIVIAAPGKHGDTAYMVKLMQDKKITEVGFVPSTLQVLLEEDGIKNCKSLKIVTAIGEALPPEIVKRFYECLPQALLINSYGPTEAAVAVTFWDCSSRDLNVPIGYPIPNTTIYILNESGRMCPQGVHGEIFIGGVQVARGYWKRPDLTAERFVKDPFSKDLKGRMYKTGDRGRFLADGTIEYQGRMDFQVKVRGFRIELGEIEAAMVEYNPIKQAAVIVKKLHGEQSAASIIAYFVKKDGAKVEGTEIRDFLKAKLPEYMIPSGFVALEELPVITSGKVNRKALMAREDQFQTESDAEEKFEAPASETEKIIAKVWEDVLRHSPIGRNTNYFALGGDSLSLIRTLQRLRQFNFGLNLEDLYNHQTIAALAELVAGKKGQSNDDSALPPIKHISESPKGKRFPLAFVQEGIWSMASVENSAMAIHMINSLDGPLDIPAFKKSIEKLMERQWVLKTKFFAEGENVFQMIEDPEVEYFFEKDLTSIPPDDFDDAINKEIQEVLGQGYDVYKSPMMKCFLLKVEENQHFLVITVHHLVFDGVSLINFQQELQELYAAQISGRKADLPELTVQYVDYATWEKETYVDGKNIKKRMDYWKNILTDLPILKLPTDIPSRKETDEGFVRRIIEKSSMDKLTDFGKKQNSTLYLTILTAFSTTLHRVCNQNEVVFNEVFGQRPSELVNNMGYFMSLLPLRIDHSKTKSPAEILKQVKERSFGSQAHLIPTRMLWEVPLSETDRDAASKIGVMINFTMGQRNPLVLPGIESGYVELESGPGSLGDIYIHFSVRDEQIDYFITGNRELFSDQKITLMADTFEAVLKEMVEKTS